MELVIDSNKIGSYMLGYKRAITASPHLTITLKTWIAM